MISSYKYRKPNIASILRLLKFFCFIILLVCVLLYPQDSYAALPKVITFVGDSSYAPFEFIKDGKVTGIHVNYWQLWSKKVHHPIDYVLTDWPKALEMVKQGKGDVLGSLFYSKEREKDFDFTNPYYSIPANIFFDQSILIIQNIKDLQGYEIGVVSNDFAEKYLKEKLPNAILKGYDSYEKLILAFKNKEIKVFVTDFPVAMYLLSKHNLEDTIKYVEKPLYIGKVCAAVKKGNKELLDLLNTGLSGIKDTEKTSIENKWLGAKLFSKIPWHFIRFVIIVVFTVILVLVLYLINLNWQVRIATRQLSEKQKELEKAFTELKRSESKYRHLIQNQIDIIVVLGVDTGVQFANENFFALFNRKPKDILNRSILPLISANDQPKARAELEKLLAPPFKSIFELRIITSKGIRWFSWANNSVLDENDNVLEIICVGRDTTESKQTAEELFQKNNQIQAIFNNLPYLAWLKDKDSRFILINEAFTKACKLSINEILGKSDFDIWPSELAAKYRADDFIVMRTGKQKFIEEPIVIDEKTFWFETFKTPIFDSKGEIIGTTGISKDITERKRSEEERLKLETQLLHAQKMEAIGRLAGGIAHDFNNILTAILGYSDLLINQLNDENIIVKDVKEIKSAAERAAKLTKQLLIFSRKQVEQASVVELNEIIINAHRMLERIIGEDILLKIDTSSECGCVLIDPGQLEQILVNLSVNARDAMSGGGLLHIQTYAVDLDAEFCKSHHQAIPGQFNVIVVSDSGVGMDETTLMRIFEPFFTTKPKDKGTGLGLSTVFGIISNNQGFIDVYSEVGLGTTFKIYLPRVENMKMDKKVIEFKEAIGGSETILIVEDQPDVLYLTKRVLETKGYNILTANDAYEGYSIFMQSEMNIDLLLTDVVMPGKNGIELCEELRSIKNNLKVIFMSGYPEDVISHHGILQTDSNYLQKPFINEALLIKIRTILDR